MAIEILNPHPGKSFSIHRCDVDGESLLDSLIDFQAWEGLDSGLCEAKIVFASNQRFWADWNPGDNHEVSIEFSELTDDSGIPGFSNFGGRPSRWKRTFTVLSLDKYLLDTTSQQEAVHLSLGNSAILEDTRVQVSKSFKDTYYSDIVKQLLSFIGILGADIEKTANKQSIVFPRVQPLKAIKWIGERALSRTNNVTRWKLWEDNTGIHWKNSLNTRTTARIFEYSMGQDEDRGNDQFDHIPESAWIPGIVLDKFDWNMSGQGGGDTITWNPITREYQTNESTISDFVQPSPRTDFISNDRGARTSFEFGDFESTGKQPSSDIVNDISKLGGGYSTATVTINGRSDMIPGDIIRISHIDPDGNVVPHTSGDWTVRTIRHRINRERFQQYVEVYRLVANYD